VPQGEVLGGLVEFGHQTGGIGTGGARVLRQGWALPVEKRQPAGSPVPPQRLGPRGDGGLQVRRWDATISAIARSTARSRRASWARERDFSPFALPSAGIATGPPSLAKSQDLCAGAIERTRRFRPIGPGPGDSPSRDNPNHQLISLSIESCLQGCVRSQLVLMVGAHVDFSVQLPGGLDAVRDCRGPRLAAAWRSVKECAASGRTRSPWRAAGNQLDLVFRQPCFDRLEYRLQAEETG
jgi:hypothetical protein